MSAISADRPSGEPTPEDEIDFRERLEQVAEEKRQALKDPGKPWGEWFFHDGAKWWVGLGFLIIDSWAVAGGLEAGLPLIGLLLLVPVTYLELLLWRFLWFRPPDEVRTRGPFHRTWLRPVEFGRWTPEGVIVRAHGRSALVPEGPNPKDFL